jgi:hypothetical protein
MHCDVVERVMRDMPSTQPWHSAQIGKSKTEFPFFLFLLFILPSFEQMMKA